MAVSPETVPGKHRASALDYVLHLRPRSWPTVGGHVLAGALMARGFGAFQPPGLWATLAAVVLWAVGLNGGTLAFNSAFDRDEDDVGFLRKPPPPPPGLALFGFAVMGGGLVAGLLFLPWAYAAAYVVCVFMSWLYSSPPARLKTRGGWDVVINMVGYGALTALAGWVAVAPTPSPGDALIFAGFAFLFAVVYPMTQFYQKEDDLRTGARTLAIVLGDRGAMVFIHVALTLAFVCWVGAGLARVGTGRALSGADWLWLLGSAVVWYAFCLDWWRRFERYPHQKGFYRSMGLWALTNAALVVAFGPWGG